MVVNVQILQAEAKNIYIHYEFIDFDDDYDINTDFKRVS